MTVKHIGRFNNFTAIVQIEDIDSVTRARLAAKHFGAAVNSLRGWVAYIGSPEEYVAFAAELRDVEGAERHVCPALRGVEA